MRHHSTYTHDDTPSAAPVRPTLRAGSAPTRVAAACTATHTPHFMCVTASSTQPRVCVTTQHTYSIRRRLCARKLVAASCRRRCCKVYTQAHRQHINSAPSHIVCVPPSPTHHTPSNRSSASATDARALGSAVGARRADSGDFIGA
jgi:hypothetical protein